MSGGKRRSKRNRTKPRVRPEVESFWREDETLAAPVPLQIHANHTAALQSLGVPPTPHPEQLLVAFAGVTERASEMAIWLARQRDFASEDGTD